MDNWPAPFQSSSLIGYLWVNGAVSIPDCTEPITTQQPDSFVSLLKIDACCHIGGMVIFVIFFLHNDVLFTHSSCLLIKVRKNYSVVDTLLEHVTRENWSTLSHSMSCRNIMNEGKSSRFFWIFFLHKSADNEEAHIHEALTEEGEAKSCLTVQNYEESHILMGNIN